jgi:cation diffusion facilitator family transporter
LSKLIVKTAEKMFHTDPTREKFRSVMLTQIAKGAQIAIVSFVANILVGIFEVSFGIFFGSLALSADGVHSFVDAIVSITVWLGIRYSQKRADGKFHYGYYKFDAIFSLFAAMIMVGSGVIISYTGVIEYFTLKHHAISTSASIIAGISIFVAVLLAIGKNRYAKSSGLVSLKTDAYNSIKDATASIIALVGIALTWFGFYGLDSIAGLIIGAFVMVAGYFSVHSSSLILADAYNNPEMLETIKRIATSVPGIQGIDDLRVRRSGPFLAVEMHIRVDGNITVFEADRISKEVTVRMRERIVSLGRVTVKPEPVQTASSHPARQ